MKKIIRWVIVFMLWAPLTSGAGTIYKWTDENGVLKFSDQPPPSTVSDYQTIESTTTAPGNLETDNQRRPSYDRMVQQAAESSETARQRRKDAAEAAAAEKERIAQEREEASRQAEKKRLETEIEAIRKRAVSKTMPHGMKQAQIDALIKKIKELEKKATGAKKK